jgi:ubiquitin carboxyl-terminal hydrolase 4/11/15
VEATKQIEIYSLPPLLVLCFQRFKSHNVYFKDKLEDKIMFPVDGLDLTPYTVKHENDNEKMIYDLYAVSNHYGSLSFGHYTAYCKNHFSGIWFDYNDSSVTALDESESVVTQASYVLYYKRRDMFVDDGVWDFASLRQSLTATSTDEDAVMLN